MRHFQLVGNGAGEFQGAVKYGIGQIGVGQQRNLRREIGAENAAVAAHGGMAFQQIGHQRLQPVQRLVDHLRRKVHPYIAVGRRRAGCRNAPVEQGETGRNPAVAFRQACQLGGQPLFPRSGIGAGGGIGIGGVQGEVVRQGHTEAVHLRRPAGVLAADQLPGPVSAGRKIGVGEQAHAVANGHCATPPRRRLKQD